MHALPAAPAPAPRRQVLVGTTLVCAAGATALGGMLALYLRFRQTVLDAGGVWRPKDTIIPEVPSNVMLISFLGIMVFAQWGVYAAKRGHRSYVALSTALVALLAIADINAQAFIYSQIQLGLKDGTYQMFFYALTGTFVALLIAGAVFSLVALFRFVGGRDDDRELLTAHAVYWYFMAVAFAALWFVVYVTK